MCEIGRHPDMQHEARTLTLHNGAHRDRNGAGDGPPLISSGAHRTRRLAISNDRARPVPLVASRAPVVLC